MNEASDTLLPCPFCGGGGFWQSEHDSDGFGVFWAIRCADCGSCTQQHYVSHGSDCPEFRAEVRASWNARAAVPAEPPMYEQRLRQVLDVVQRYLPPYGIALHDAMGEIIGLVDPWPVAAPQSRPGEAATAHVWSLVFDYPGENATTVGVADRDDLIEKLREDVSDAGEPNMIEGIADQLLREGVWHDEGGCIRLYAHGVSSTPAQGDADGVDLPDGGNQR